MKFNPEAMRALLMLDDTALWAKIRGIAGGAGIKLSENTPPPAEMQKIRTALGGYGQGDVQAAMDTISRFRRGD